MIMVDAALDRRQRDHRQGLDQPACGAEATAPPWWRGSTRSRRIRTSCWRTAMNLDDLVAIDVHTHAETSTPHAARRREKEALEARGRYFRYQVAAPDHPADGRVLPRAEDGVRRLHGGPRAGHGPAHLQRGGRRARARACRRRDPVRKHRSGARQDGRARSAAADQGLRRERLQVPSDRSRASSRTTGRLSALRGRSPRRGCRRCSTPARPASAPACPAAAACASSTPTRCYLDDVAADFPDMPIIMAHPSFPWQDEALSVALHKPQVYIDLSGWSPKYFPPHAGAVRQHAAARHKSCSAPTTRSSRPTAGWRISSSSTSSRKCGR